MLVPRRLAKLTPLLLLMAVMLLVISLGRSPVSRSFPQALLELQKYQLSDGSLKILVRSNSSNNTDHTPKPDSHPLRYLFDSRATVNRTTKPDLALHPIFPGFSIKNPGLCKDQKVDILVYLHTPPDHRDTRRHIRDTWGSSQTFTDIHVKLLFVMGKPSVELLQLKVLTESAAYGDIVQGDFIDTFRNLTYKALTAMSWINDHCVHAKYVIKVDDDQFVDTFRVVEDILPKLYRHRFAQACDHKNNMAIIRERNTRWYLSEEVLPQRTVFPPFCPGYFTVFTGDLVPVLFEESFSWKKLISPVDDVFFFGLLPESRNLSIKIHNLHGSITPGHRPDPKEEIHVNGKFEYVSFGVYGDSDHRTFWKAKLTRLSDWEQRHSVYIQDVIQQQAPCSQEDSSEVKRSRTSHSKTLYT